MAKIVRSGFDWEILPVLAFSPVYGPALSQIGLTSVQQDNEFLAVHHQQLFGFDLPPFAGVFLDAEGQVGGPLSGKLLANLEAIGATSAAQAESPEHLAEQLDLLGNLVGGEVEGWENERPEEWEGFQLAQGLVLHQHLMPWLAPLVVALKIEAPPPYRVLAEQLWQTVCAHRDQLDARCDGFDEPVLSGREPLALLAQERTGLAQIAEFLVRPIHSGFYLSRSALAQLGGGRGHGPSPGSRDQMMEDLLQSMEPEAFASALDGICQRWQTAYKELANSSLTVAWQAKLEGTRALLRQFAEAGKQGLSD